MASDNKVFWPSLYSRLVPHRYAPNQDLSEARGAGRELYFLTDFQTLRHHIQTDLIDLLNATSLEATLMSGEDPPVVEADGNSVVVAHDLLPFSDYPLVRRSVLNYGLPSMIGRAIYRMRIRELEDELREALLAYEPRLRAETLKVEISLEQDETRVNPDGPVGFDIVAEVHGTPTGMHLRINTVWDLEKVHSAADVGR